MKKSEMVRKISNLLLKLAPETYEEQSSYGRRLDAQAILEVIEKNGMLPPYYFKIGANDPEYEGQHVQEWEKE